MSKIAGAQYPDGSFGYLELDNSGNLKCTVTGAGSGGTSSVDEATFVAGTSAGTPLMLWDPGSGQLVIAQAASGTRQMAISGSFSSSPPFSSTASAVAQTAVGTTSASILAANGVRKGCSVKNTGTTVLKLGLGKTPTGTAYHISLQPGSVADDGFGGHWDGTVSGVLWTGAVNAISSAAGGTCVVTELT